LGGLPLPATTFPVLKGGLDPHAPAILLETFAPGRLIRNEKPGLFMALFPHRTRASSRMHAPSTAEPCQSMTGRCAPPSLNRSATLEKGHSACAERTRLG